MLSSSIEGLMTPHIHLRALCEDRFIIEQNTNILFEKTRQPSTKTAMQSGRQLDLEFDTHKRILTT